MNRRELMQLGALAASALATTRVEAAPATSSRVVTPDGSSLPLRTVRGVKVGHLVAHEFEREFTAGLTVKCWGYNGSTPGPTLELTQGDRVRLYVTNRLPEPTTIHWHGLLVPNGMDGVGGLTQRSIPPGATWRYEFTVEQAGTFMYHPHLDEMTQMALGMVGMFVVHPRAPRGPRVDRDYVLMTHEWSIHAGTRRPDPNAMSDFNVLTFNGKCFPDTAPLPMHVGERVRIRFGNLSPMEHHPIHLHGVNAVLTQTDGGDVPESARHPETTFLVPAGTVRVIEFTPTRAGDWPMHCHMTHHAMNQMGHAYPTLIGADAKAIDAQVRPLVPGYMTMGHDGMAAMAKMSGHMAEPENTVPMKPGRGPFGTIDMGGMFTVLKVRARGSDFDGWYEHPDGTVAREAGADELAADGIELG